MTARVAVLVVVPKKEEEKEEKEVKAEVVEEEAKVAREKQVKEEEAAAVEYKEAGMRREGCGCNGGRYGLTWCEGASCLPSFLQKGLPCSR